MATAQQVADLFFKLLDEEIAEAQQKAEVSGRRRKWMMEGYWKAIGVHKRKQRRRFKKEVEKLLKN